ncbi:MAG TPA: hypothetical protein VL382_09800, partial [Terriglobales bacterium]|nr:hypothetical protein [Terriglobales bacterium]
FNTLGSVNKLDSTVGYSFNQHFEIDAGVPFYMVSASNSTTGAQSGAGLGDVYLDLVFRAPKTVSYTGDMRVTVPTGSTSSGLSTGRATIFFNNHIERAFSHWTPFVDFGIGNSVQDSMLYTRPFSSLGAVADLDGGASYRFTKFVALGGSLYGVVPMGEQKVYSKLLGKGVSGGSVAHGRVFDANGLSSGTGITQDYGASTWLAVTPNRFLVLQAGYTRSVSYALNTFSFGVGTNLGAWRRATTRQ